MNSFNKKQKIIGLIVIGILVIGFSFFVYENKKGEVISYENILVNETDIIEDTKIENNDENIETESKTFSDSEIIVYVTGEVNNEGVYGLEPNSRISDAIQKAGGLKADADISEINLAYILEDGMKIKIPSKNETKQENVSEDKITEVISSSSGVTSNNATSNKKQGKININTATQEELESLPGIGEATALKIIDYRNKSGKFSKIEDIKEVSGMGENKFEKIKDLICVK